MKIKHLPSRIATAIVFGLVAATSAQADIAPTTGVSSSIELRYSTATFGGYQTFTGVNNSTNISPPAGSLLFDAKATSASSVLGSFASYCVELSQYAQSSWNTYTLSAFAPNVGSSLARLYQVAGGSPIDMNKSAAFQAAVWEITYETGAGYSLGDGSFHGSFADSNITNQANTWLTAVNTFHGTELFKAQKYVSSVAQDQLVITAVPEPETYAMFLAGLGIMGAVARRRKKI